MTYDEWERDVPREIRQEVIWRVQAYRLALFLAACAELDTRDVAEDARFTDNARQLCRSAGSVGANIAEGYPKQSTKDRIRFYTYALRSLAEAKTWYLSIRVHIAGTVMNDRLQLMRSVTRLLNTMVRRPQ